MSVSKVPRLFQVWLAYEMFTESREFKIACSSIASAVFTIGETCRF